MNDKEHKPEDETLNPEHAATMLYALRCGHFEYAKFTRDLNFPANNITRIPGYEEAVIEGLNKMGRVDQKHLPYGTVDVELSEMLAFYHEFGRALIRLSDSEGYKKLLAGVILTTLDVNYLTTKIVDEAIEIRNLYGEGVNLSLIEQFTARIKQIFDYNMKIGQIEIAVKLRIGLGNGMNLDK